MAQITAVNSETVTLTQPYKDFEDVFSTLNASYLRLHDDHHNAIDFVDGRQSFYGLFTAYLKMRCQFFELILTRS